MSIDALGIGILAMAAIVVWLGIALLIAYSDAKAGHLTEGEMALYSLLWPLVLAAHVLTWPWRLVVKMGERRGGWKK